LDAIELLKKDHRKVDEIFEKLQKAKGQEREKLFDQLAQELTVHATIEEQLFYPAVKDAKQTHDIVLESFEEHKQVKIVLKDLSETDKSTEEWLAGVKVLMEDVQHHVKEEEEELFPKVKDKILPSDKLQQLGTQMEQMKQRELAKVKA
jgi:hemerythrin superfamily protein